MPKISSEQDEFESALAEWREFERPVAWHRNAKNNLVRTWDGATVTVFRRAGAFRWSVNDQDGETRFSRGGYETEADAMEAAGTAAGVAEWFVGGRGD